MDLRSVYRILLSALAAAALAGGLWLAVAPEPSPGVEIGRPEPTATPTPGPAPDAPDAGTPAPLIDINTATAEELRLLPGVGEVIAGRIVAHREANGPFRRADQLMGVRGIGPATFERVRPLITVGP